MLPYALKTYPFTNLILHIIYTAIREMIKCNKGLVDKIIGTPEIWVNWYF